MKSLRIAFAGASGTGKTTLSKWISETYGLPLNPVGSVTIYSLPIPRWELDQIS